VLQWNTAALRGVRDAGFGPPIVARALAIVHICIYDAWAAYDPVAVGTRYGAALRRPPGQRTVPNEEQAISVAAYRATVDLFPADRTTVFAPLMSRLGYPTDTTTTDLNHPAGGRNVACQAVLDYRHHDGANQLGDEPGGTPAAPYSDYTGYRPINDPMDLTIGFNPSTVHDPNRWQPLRYLDPQGKTRHPDLHRPALGARRRVRAAGRRGAALPHRGRPVGQRRLPRPGAGAARHQFPPDRPAEDDRRVLGRRTPHRTAIRPLGPIRPICFPP